VTGATPNIYELYAENVGELTPYVADVLRDFEEEFPVEDIEYAVREAVQLNKRSLRYIGAILSRLATEREEADSEIGWLERRYRDGKARQEAASG
jgi:DnaD/phage-associated family protein